MAKFWAVPVFCKKSWPSEVLTQRPIFQHGLVDHTAKLINTKALLTMEKYFSIHVRAKIHKKIGLDRCLQCLLSGVSQAWPAGLRENGMSAKVRVRISRIMLENMYTCTRPLFYSWEKFCMYMYTRDVNWHEVVNNTRGQDIKQFYTHFQSWTSILISGYFISDWGWKYKSLKNIIACRFVHQMQMTGKYPCGFMVHEELLLSSPGADTKRAPLHKMPWTRSLSAFSPLEGHVVHGVDKGELYPPFVIVEHSLSLLFYRYDAAAPTTDGVTGQARAETQRGQTEEKETPQADRPHQEAQDGLLLLPGGVQEEFWQERRADSKGKTDRRMLFSCNVKLTKQRTIIDTCNW